MKAGGADVRVLNREAINPNGEDWRGEIVANARGVADQATDAAPLVGFIVVGMFSDGCTSVGFRYDPARTPIPRVLIPSWIAEVLRRDMVTAPEAEHQFNEMFEWRS